MQFNVTKSIIYHAISHGLNQKPFADLQSAIDSNPYFIIKEKDGSWYNDEYINAIYEVEFFDPTGKQLLFFYEGKWQMQIPKVQTNDHVQAKDICTKMIDPEGKETKTECFGQGFWGVMNAFKKFRKMAEFECLDHYMLSLENEKLEAEIKRTGKLNDEICIKLALNEVTTIVKSKIWFS